MRKTGVMLFALALCLAIPLSTVSADGEGKELYDKKCAMCHGKDGVAKKMGAGSGDFNDPAWQEANSAEAIAEVTSEGDGKMKAYKDKLTPEQIEMIAKYVKTLK